MQKVRAMAAAAALAGATGAGVLAAPSAGAAKAAEEEHCVVHVVGQDEATGELHVSAPVCASPRASAVQRDGVGASASDFPIGVHFEGAGYTGSSLTVVGADCTGGWLNVPAAWNNRISSTLNGCPRIRHFDGSNLVPPEQTTLAPGANLLSLDNKTSSIQYLP